MDSGQRLQVTLVVMLTAVGAALRLYQLDADLWLDEIMTLTNYMQLPWWESATTFHSANHHFLNSVLGSISLALFGESAWAARVPAVVFGIASIPMMYRLATIVTSRREAIVSTLLLAISYHHVWFSQNARGYSAMVFWTITSTALLLLARRYGGTRRWVLYSAASSLGLLSLLNYAFVLAGQAVAALAVPDSGSRRRSAGPMLCSMAGAGFLAAVGYAGILPEMTTYFLRGGAEMGWTDPAAFIAVTVRGLLGHLSVATAIAMAAGVAVGALGWVSFWRERPVLALLLALPAGINLLALVVLGFGAYPRSFLYVLPFALLCGVRGGFLVGRYAVTAWPGAPDRVKRVAPWLLPAAMIMAFALVLPANYRFPKQDYTSALAYVERRASTQDAIAVVGYLAGGYKAYYAPDLAFPRSSDELRSLKRDHSTVWVLYSFTRDMRRHFQGINDYLGSHFELRKRFPGTLGDGTIHVGVLRDSDTGPGPEEGSHP